MPTPGPADEVDAAPLDLPQVWRIPPWQPAALILLAAVLAGLDLYAGLSLGPLIMTAVIAVAAVCAAVFAIRMVLVADEDGIWVRRLVGVEFVEWRDVRSVEVVTLNRNAGTIRITRRQGTFVDVPPSLLLPTLPTKVHKARTIVHSIALELTRIAAAQRA